MSNTRQFIVLAGCAVVIGLLALGNSGRNADTSPPGKAAITAQVGDRVYFPQLTVSCSTNQIYSWEHLKAICSGVEPGTYGTVVEIERNADAKLSRYFISPDNYATAWFSPEFTVVKGGK